MCADLSNLKLTTEEVDIPLEDYVDPSEFPPPIPAGTYTFIQGKPTFEPTKDGFLSANMTHEVSGGEYDKRKLPFDRISNKPFDRQGHRATMMNDHLRAVGHTGAPRSHQEFADAIEASEGKPFNAQVDWDGYCGHKDTPLEGQEAFTVRGERNFPPAGNGTSGHLDSTRCPTCKQEVRARAKITRRIPYQQEG